MINAGCGGTVTAFNAVGGGGPGFGGGGSQNVFGCGGGGTNSIT